MKNKIEKTQFVENGRLDESQHLELHQQYLDLKDIISKIEENGGFRAGNFFLINLETVTAMVGTILTYIIIFLTWPGAEDDYIPDYLKGVCCFCFNQIRKETNTTVNEVRNKNI